MEFKIIVTVLFAVASTGSAVAAYLMWRTRVRQTEMMNEQWTWEAFLAANLEADSDESLRIYGITQEMLEQHDLTHASLRAYILVTNIAWRTRLSYKNFRHLNRAGEKFESFEDGVNFIIENDLGWPRESSLQTVFSTKGFEQAWPLIQSFWEKSATGHTAQLIEATVRRASQERTESSRLYVRQPGFQ